MKRIWVCTAAIVAAITAPAAAEAAYPGTNGKIVFSSGPTGGLLSIDPNGSNQQSFASDGTGAPSFSADGSKVAYALGDEPGGIVVRNTNGTGTPFVLPAPADAGPSSYAYRSPALSSDGKRVVFSSSSGIAGFASYEIRTADVNGSGVSVFLAADALQPVFSPNGATIYFTRLTTFSSSGDIYAVSSAGGASSAVTEASTADDERSPEVSPDGSKLIYQRKVGGDYDIYELLFSGTASARVASSLDETDPVFSPDGTKIAFTRTDDIYTVNSDGTGVGNVTNSAALDSGPGWSAPFPPAPPSPPAQSSGSGGAPPPTARKKCKKKSRKAAAAKKKCKKKK